MIKKRKDDFSYTEKLPDNWSACRELLENYSKIPPNEVEKHVRAVVRRLYLCNASTPLHRMLTAPQRSKAYSVYPYPCVGGFRFLDVSISNHPLYASILHRLNSDPSQRYLDFGCCFGQDLRRLVADGADSAQMCGADLLLEFIDLGYELFRDKETLKATFVKGDVFARHQGNKNLDKGLMELDGKVDVIHAASFLHLFSWNEQVIAAERLCGFLREDAADAVIFGHQLGSGQPRPFWRRGFRKGTMFRHDAATFQMLWDEVGERVGRKFTVKAELRDAKGWAGKSNESQGIRMRPMIFEVHRL